MSEDKTEKSWRDTSNYLVDIGRCLEAIESALSQIRATGVVNHAGAQRDVEKMCRAANALVRALQSLRFSVNNK